jgi:hypothetical protein
MSSWKRKCKLRREAALKEFRAKRRLRLQKRPRGPVVQVERPKPDSAPAE